MFERFTERARQVVVLAQEEARGFRHDYIGTEHVLLGLLREEQGLGAHVLEVLGVTTDHVRNRVLYLTTHGEAQVTGQIPFTPRAKKVLELALREALSLGHNYIGTEHILLALVRENEGVAAAILMDAGSDSEKVRSEVMRALVGPRRLPTDAPPPERHPRPRPRLPRVGAGPTLTDSEQAAMDSILDTMNRIQNLNGQKLVANVGELAQAVHVLQSFVVQSACGRLGLFGCTDSWWAPNDAPGPDA